MKKWEKWSAGVMERIHKHPHSCSQRTLPKALGIAFGYPAPVLQNSVTPCEVNRRQNYDVPSRAVREQTMKELKGKDVTWP